MDELQSLIKNILHPRSVIYGKDKASFQEQPTDERSGKSSTRTVAPFDISVLILGPNGAGKESVAQRIHYSSDAGKAVPGSKLRVISQRACARSFRACEGCLRATQTVKALKRPVAGPVPDEVGILSMEVQSMLLRGLAGRQPYPIGSNRRNTPT